MPETLSDSAMRILGRSIETASEIERRVLQAVTGRRHVARHVHRDMEEGLTLGERLSDWIAAWGGSWSFLVLFFVFLFGWIGLNSWVLISRPFDPYPYILLNLVLSTLAAVQAPVILMSQNRQAAKDRLQAAHDYEVNLKAEIEILQLHEKVDRLTCLLEELGAGRRRPG
ncbi:MAG TPA: DUF1003 domain-containing protein [Candidatus Polarisedimenticolia bacterium]|jgi:uncharacterized membrane protein|nr:DUF1003 domain-containing protein [Candidatus Polarisedimenticolia bacterium]